MFVSAPFDGPRKLIERSQRRAEDLKAEIAAMKSTLRYYFIKGPTESGMETFFLQFSDHPTADMSMTFRESFNSLRVALDLLVADACRVLGKPAEEMNEVKYPFAKDLDGLQNVFKRMKLPKPVEDILFATHPLRIPENKWLRDLHDLDIQTKHRIFLPVFATAAGRFPYALPEAVFDLAARNGIDFRRMPMQWSHGSKLQTRPGNNPYHRFHPTGDLDIAIPDGFPFAREPASQLLQNLAASVGSLVEIFFHLFSPSGNPAHRATIREVFQLP